MNIGIFTDTYIPQINGVVTVTRNLVEGLREKGHNVYIITVEHPDAIPMEGVFRLPSIKFIMEPQHRLSFPIIPHSLNKKLKNLNLDIVHTHTEFGIGIIGRTVAKKFSIPHVHTVHTYYEDYLHYVPLLENFLKFYMRTELRKYCNKASRIIAPSRKIKSTLEEYGVTTPINIVPNGIDLEKIKNIKNEEKMVTKFKENFGIKDNDIPIVFIGRIAEEKSIDKLLENFAKINENIPQTKLIIVGNGPDLYDLKEYTRKLNLSEKVVFTGALKWPDEISVAYKISKLFMSASSSEVHPITFIEALSIGLPIVAYEDLSVIDMVKNNENGYLIKDKKQLWKGAVKILKNPELLNKFGKKSKEISKNFSLDSFLYNTLEIYNSLL